MSGYRDWSTSTRSPPTNVPHYRFPPEATRGNVADHFAMTDSDPASTDDSGSRRTRRKFLGGVGAVGLLAAGYYALRTMGEGNPSGSNRPSETSERNRAGLTTQFRYGPRNTGVAPASVKGPTSRPDLKWSKEFRWYTEGSTPTVSDGSVYIGAAEAVYSLDAATGDVEWQNGTQSKSCPVVTDTAVHISSFGGIYSFDRETGETRWVFDRGFASNHQASSLAFADGRLVALGGGGYVYCIDPATGTRLWRTPVDEMENAVLGAPAITDGVVFVGDHGGNCYALSLDDGSVQWRDAIDGRIIAAPVVDSGTVYVGGTDLAAFDVESGTKQATYDVEGEVLASPVVTPEKLLVTPHSMSAVALNRGDGDVLWERTFDRELQAVLGAPVLSGDTVYRVTTSGHVTAMDVETGETRFQVRYGDRMTGPRVHDDTLYVLTRDQGGRLLALE